jgi:hypothetical protein
METTLLRLQERQEEQAEKEQALQRKQKNLQDEEIKFRLWQEQERGTWHFQKHQEAENLQRKAAEVARQADAVTRKADEVARQERYLAEQKRELERKQEQLKQLQTQKEQQKREDEWQAKRRVEKAQEEKRQKEIIEGKRTEEDNFLQIESRAREQDPKYDTRLWTIFSSFLTVLNSTFPFNFQHRLAENTNSLLLLRDTFFSLSGQFIWALATIQEPNEEAPTDSTLTI